MESILGKYFKIALVGLIFFELLSLLGYLQTSIGKIVFFIIILAALFLSLVKLEYGVYILLAELFIGSKGYLFYLEVGKTLLSLRIALFLVILSVWLAKIIVYYFKNKNLGLYLKFKKSNLFYWCLLFFIFIVWGIINGLMKGNGFNNIFFDANGWLYFGLVFILFDTITSFTEIKSIIQIFLASVFVLGIKTFFLLFIFSHQMIEMISLYRWASDTGLAEITDMGNGFYRIFFQSQIYALIILFVLLSALYYKLKINLSLKGIIKKDFIYFIFNVLLISLVIVSLSRSFWAGFLIGLASFFTIIFYCDKAKIIIAGKLAIYYFAVIFLSLSLIILLVKFPYPKPTEVSLASMLGERAFSLEGESAVSSRWNLLRPLWQEVKFNFIFGSGFGKTVTYQSQDPRQQERGQGIYTTYAFEWGYLDIWLKMGILGLISYLILIYKIWQKGWLKLKTFTDNFQQKKSLVLGFLLGIIVILATSIFSPYLNHPLGIGYLMIASVVFEVL